MPVHDAVADIARQVYSKSGSGQPPWYMRQRVGRGLTGKDLDDALAGWQLQFPDRVKKAEN